MAPEAAVRRVFLYAPRTQFENLGDAIINRTWVEQLAARGEVVTFGPVGPPDYAAFIGMAPEATGSLGGLVRLLLDARAGRVELVRALRPGHFDPAGWSSPKAVLHGIRIRVMTLLQRVCRVETVWMGTSIAPGPWNRWHTFAATGLLASPDRFCVRDEGSADAVAAAGLARPRVLPDLAFALDVAPYRRSRSGGIAVSLRSGPAAGVVAPALRASAGVAAVPLVFVSQVRRDNGVQRRLADEVGVGSVVEATTTTETARSAAAVYEDAAVVVSNRLHVLLLAASRGCLPVAVIDARDDHKVAGVMGLLQATDLVVSSSDPEALTERLLELLEDGEDRRAQLCARFAALAADLDAGLAEVLGPRTVVDPVSRIVPAAIAS